MRKDQGTALEAGLRKQRKSCYPVGMWQGPGVREKSEQTSWRRLRLGPDL